AAASPDVPQVEGDRAVFSEAFAKRIGLEVAAVRRGPLTPVISVVGTVTLDPEHVAAVGTRLRGVVRNVRRFEGDSGKRGGALGEIDGAELGAAPAAVRRRQAGRAAASVNAQREQQLLERGLSPARESEVAQAELQKCEARH